MKALYIFDLDGTLANLDHRLPLVKREVPDWPGFFRACVDDEPIDEMIALLRSLHLQGAEIWIVSGRSDEVQEQTEDWLRRHEVPFDALVMRHEGDYRPDHEIKQEMYDRMLIEDLERVALVFDDRSRVVDMWRANGLRCLQVAPGDF